MMETLTANEVAHRLYKDEYGGWSWEGAKAMAEYLEQFEEDMGAPIEFDRVAIRCDFSEYTSLRDWADDYFGGRDEASRELGVYATADDELDGHEREEDDEKIRDYITDRGQLIEFDGGIIVSSF